MLVVWSGQSKLHVVNLWTINTDYYWFQTSALFRMLYYFFWVISWRLNFVYQRFGALCSIFSVMAAYAAVTLTTLISTSTVEPYL